MPKHATLDETGKVPSAQLPTMAGNSATQVVLGSDSTPVTTGQTQTITADTTIVLFANASSLNVRLDCSASIPVQVRILRKSKRGSDIACDITVSANSATAWAGVLRPTGTSPIWSAVNNSLDFIELEWSPNQSAFILKNYIPSLL